MTQSRRFPRARSGIALYVTVAGVAMLVSVLGLAGLTLVSVERRQNETAGGTGFTRLNARSAVALGLARINEVANWRTTFANGTEMAAQTLGPSSTGTLSWKLVDTDGSLSLPDTNLRLHGIGRLGDAVHVASVQLVPETTEVGPILLREYTSSSSSSDDDVDSGKWYSQYFRPNLPAEAIGWRVSSVNLYLDWRVSSVNLYLDPYSQRQGSATFGLYVPGAAYRPGSTVVDQTSVAISSLATSWGWKTINFSGVYSRAVTDALCLTVTSTNANKLAIRYRSGSASASNSALCMGRSSWNWDAGVTDKALLYRVYGIYSKLTGKMVPAPGTWQSEAAP